jgi:branched-chain amino acid transport system ATP-binding protein
MRADMGTPILSVRDLDKHFGGLLAVSSLSFDVQPGEILGLMGPNGAGKSTTFNIIAGEYKPDAGEVIYDGKNITGLFQHIVCHMGLSRTYQIPQPFTNLTALQNVMVGAVFGRRAKKKEAKRKAAMLLDLVNLYEKKDVFTRDLPILSLKKLELARALASDPKLVLLDEVAAGTTEEEIPRILKIIKTIHKMNKTVIMVEHVMKVIMEAVDRIIVMDKGRKIAEGKPDEIMEHKKVIEAYFGE